LMRGSAGFCGKINFYRRSKLCGTKLAIGTTVRIAIPICQGRVSPVFDVASRLILVQLKDQAELERKEVGLGQSQPEAIVHSLAAWGVDMLICGALSRELQMALESAGIKVLPHICGEAESVLVAYRAGKLQRAQFVMPGCCRRRRGGRRGACGCQRGFLSPPSSIR
jgi:predicted Fe-Mo cluster-binding NifX family protein